MINYLDMRSIRIFGMLLCLFMLHSCLDCSLWAQKRNRKQEEVTTEARKLLEKERQVEAERAVLKALYWATGGEEWTFNDNWLSDKPITDWYGVNRNYDDGKLTIYLGGNHLKGNLPRELFDLKSISVLNLCNNKISGELPEELGNCTGLKQLSLNGNQLTGSIPSRIVELSELANPKIHPFAVPSPQIGERVQQYTLSMQRENNI